MIEGTFHDSLTIYNKSSRDKYGKITWGTGVAVTGRFVEKAKLLVDDVGQKYMSEAHIHLPASTVININSRVKFGTTNYKVKQINKPKDIAGTVRHVKAFLSKLDSEV